MKDSGSPPQAPDPNVVIPLQTAANKDMFNYALDASRVNQVSPYGTQGWTSTDNFDQAGYDKAMADWNAKYGPQATGQSAAGASAGFTGYTPSYYMNGGADGNPNGQMSPVLNAMQSAGGGGSTPAAPSRDAFTKKNWTYTQAFSPEQQKLYDQNVASQMQQGDLLKGLGENVANAVSKPMDWSSLPQLTGSIAGPEFSQAQGILNSTGDLRGLLSGLGGKIGELNPQQFNDTASDALYRQATRYLDPQAEQQKKALEARLAEQGFVPGTPGYDQAMQNFMDTNNRAYSDARDRALTLGSSVGSQQFGNSLDSLKTQIAAILSGGQFDMGRAAASQGLQQAGFQDRLAGGTFGNQARNQAMAELLQQRNQPLNELNAMRTGTQVNLPSNQAQYATPNLQTPDIMGAYQNQYMGNLGAYNANVASDNAGLGSLLSLGTSLAMAPMTGGGSLFGNLFSGLGKP